MVSGENRVWMLTGESVTSIDPMTNRVAEVVDLPFAFGGMVEASEILWFPVFDADVVHRYDLDSGEWLDEVVVLHHPNRISVHDGSVWIGNGHGRWLSRINPATGDVVANWSPLEDDGAEESAPPNAFWGTSSDARQAFAIDSSTNTLAAELDVTFSPCAAQAVSDRVWVAPCIEAGQEPQIQALDRSTGSNQTIELPGWPIAMMPVDARVWLPLLKTDDLDGEAGVSIMIALDPTSGKVEDVVEFDPPVYGAVIAFDALWLPTLDSVLRIPLTELRLDS